MANSTSYLTAAGFSDGFFSAPVISQIESIGGGPVGGGVGRWEGGWGQVESRRRGKAPIQTQRAVLCLQ